MSACPICASPTRFAFEALVLKKHRVKYFHCETCGLLRTESPYWLDEAYAEAITRQDTGLVARNLAHARLLPPLLDWIYPTTATFVDVGGGYGLLTRLMRDQGFDTYTSDPFCQPVLAPGFTAPPGLKAHALFAFEVLEHIHDPVPFVAAAFQAHACRSLIFSTQLFQPPVPPPSWDYYGFDHGQHVTLYTRTALERLARRFDAHYVKLPHGLHWITDRPPTGFTRLVITRRKLLRFAWSWRRTIAATTRPDLKLADSRLMAERGKDVSSQAQ